VFFIGGGERSLAFEQKEIELTLTDIDTDVECAKEFCHEYSALLNSGSGPIRLFELHEESTNRCTLVNGLRFCSLGSRSCFELVRRELRIAHGPQLIPMSARSRTYKQLQRTVIRRRGRVARAPFHYARASRWTRGRAAAELRR